MKFLLLDILISIHALTGSATSTNGLVKPLGRFQSTHSRGVRPLYCYSVAPLCYISIHALTGSATKTLSFVPSADYVFQSTHSRGVRRFYIYKIYCDSLFQSTHSRGVRHNQQEYNNFIKTNFNPRTHGECDLRLASIIL